MLTYILNIISIFLFLYLPIHFIYIFPTVCSPVLDSNYSSYVNICKYIHITVFD